MRMCAAILLGLMSMPVAWADEKKAQSCAQSLQGEPKLIYDVSAAAVAAGVEGGDKTGQWSGATVVL